MKLVARFFNRETGAEMPSLYVDDKGREFITWNYKAFPELYYRIDRIEARKTMGGQYAEFQDAVRGLGRALLRAFGITP